MSFAKSMLILWISGGPSNSENLGYYRLQGFSDLIILMQDL